jgi:aspartyl protease family protein
MGHVNVRARITHPTDNTLSEEVDAMVDTGATFTSIPRSLANALRLPVTGKTRLRTGTGEIIEDHGRAFVQIDGQSEINRVVISDTLDKVLIGVITLETFSLTVDPSSGQLKESEAYLLATEDRHD